MNVGDKVYYYSDKDEMKFVGKIVGVVSKDWNVEYIVRWEGSKYVDKFTYPSSHLVKA